MSNKVGLLLFCVAGIYTCFLLWGILQETLSTTAYDKTTGAKFTFFVFLNLVQAGVAALVGYLYTVLVQKKKLDEMPRSLAGEYLKIALLSCLASPFGYASLKHIDYPTLILGKSCKLVPVVVMNFILYRKIYPLKKYLIVILVTAGVSLFMFLDPKKSSSKSPTSSSSLYGIFLLSINLAMDGAYNTSQDQVFHKYKIQGTTMMTMMNLFSFAIMGLYLLLNPYSDELSQAVSFCMAHPAAIRDMLQFALAGSLGQCFIFLTLERFGSLALVTVTVTRKMFSILLSVFWFGHQLSLGQWGAVALVFLAIAWESAGKATPPDAIKDEDVKLASLADKKTGRGKGKKKED